MTQLITCFYSSLIFLFVGCAGPRDVTLPAEWKGNKLQFGSGGGFTGAVHIYTLLDNGQLFSETGLVITGPKQLRKVGKTETKKLFAKAAKIAWGEKDISEPGN